jgi:hypothetical protein
MRSAMQTRRSAIVVAIALGLLTPLGVFAATWWALPPEVKAPPREGAVAELPGPPPSLPQAVPRAPLTLSPPPPPPAAARTIGEAVATQPVLFVTAPPFGEPPGTSAVAEASAPVAAAVGTQDAAATWVPPPSPVSCGPTTCASGETCCNATCGICTRPGETCTRQNCGTASYPTSSACGPNTCNVGEVCCNSTCGTCVPAGTSCDTTPCDNGPTLPVSQSCGMNTCSVGLVCCDARCGLCAPAAQCAQLHC